MVQASPSQSSPASLNRQTWTPAGIKFVPIAMKDIVPYLFLNVKEQL